MSRAYRDFVRHSGGLGARGAQFADRWLRPPHPAYLSRGAARELQMAEWCRVVASPCAPVLPMDEEGLPEDRGAPEWSVDRTPVSIRTVLDRERRERIRERRRELAEEERARAEEKRVRRAEERHPVFGFRRGDTLTVWGMHTPPPTWLSRSITRGVLHLPDGKTIDIRWWNSEKLPALIARPCPTPEHSPWAWQFHCNLRDVTGEIADWGAYWIRLTKVKQAERGSG